jgi:hypothetical protein
MSDPEQAKAQWAEALLWLAKADEDIQMAGLAAPTYGTLEQRMLSFSHLTEWLTATRYPDLGSGLGEAIGDVADMLATIRAFRQEVAVLVP